MGLTVEEAVSQLRHRQSPKRRSAAKALRKGGEASAGPALFAALQAEVRDPRTWETQYQMVMAVAECNYKPALAWLIEFAQSLDDPLMLAVGVGDAVIRLSDDRGGAVEWALQVGNRSLLDGVLRALAMTSWVPSTASMRQLLLVLDQQPPDDGLRYWAAVAAIDWPKDVVGAHLERWAKLPRHDVAVAARDSLAGYRRPQSHL